MRAWKTTWTALKKEKMIKKISALMKIIQKEMKDLREKMVKIQRMKMMMNQVPMMIVMLRKRRRRKRRRIIALRSRNYPLILI